MCWRLDNRSGVLALSRVVLKQKSNDYQGLLSTTELFIASRLTFVVGLSISRNMVAEHRKSKVSDLDCEAAVDDTTRASQVSMALDLATVNEQHAFYNVDHQM